MKISTVKLTPKQIQKIPAVGGEADIVQYLQVVPGIVFSGDQGGQLYVRGGSPIQTKVMLDGVTVYNPFHSIGFFSVFETDLIRNVDVYTGGFDAQYGGRISAVIDITTKDGNKKRHAGKLTATPFLSKVTLEGPIKKLEEDSDAGSISYVLNTKYSYLDQSSKLFYSYIDTTGLPFSFLDIYGKLSFNAKNGSKLNFYGYNYTDDVIYLNQSAFSWDAIGFGGSFVVIPPQSKTLINGYFAYSDYGISLTEGDSKPRTSDIGGFNIGVNFSYFFKNNQQIKYGFDVGGFSTELKFFNVFNTIIEQKENTTEIASYFKYRSNINEKFVFEPSLRMSFYPSLSTFAPEPRLGLKYNITSKFRIKASGGLFTQNFISTKSDRDIVNLFTGFVSGPEGQLETPDGGQSRNNLQTAAHAIAGFELDLKNKVSFNVEGYYKRFGQLINFNRTKLQLSDPDFVIENGNAYGFDFLAKYDKKRWFIWGVYSLAFTDRFDGEQTYNPHYDRRHNFNFVSSYTFGKDLDWETSFRWNYGSGFPFTKTQGFYEQVNLDDGISTDVINQNGTLGILYDDELNTGRLPDYHRLDGSVKKKFYLSDISVIEVIASVTNVYNRENIFFFDRVRYERVNQLPILPSIGASWTF